MYKFITWSISIDACIPKLVIFLNLKIFRLKRYNEIVSDLVEKNFEIEIAN